MAAAVSTSDVVLCVIDVVVIVIICVALRHTVIRPGLLGVLKNISRTIRDALWQRADTRDEAAVEAEKRIRELKVQHFHWLSFLVGPVGFLLIGSTQIILVASGEDRAPFLHRFAVNAMLTPFVVVALRPSLARRTMYPLYICVVLLLTALSVVAVYTNRSEVCGVIGNRNFGMALLAAVMRDFWIVAPMNAIFALATAGAMTVSGEPLHVALVQVAWLLVITVSASALEACLRTAVVQGLHLKSAQQLLTAAVVLLQHSCDVVCQLDSEGVIVEDGGSLGSFLLRGIGYDLQGQHFVDLIKYEEDRRAFMAKLHAPREDGANTAEAMHVRMRDGNSTVLKLRLLIVSYVRVDGTLRHMVGVRSDEPERADNSHRPEVSGASARPPPAPLPVAIGAELPSPRSSSGDAPSSGATSSDEPEAAEDTISEAAGDLPALMTVGTDDGMFPVLTSSTGFRARMGRLPQNTNLREIVKHGHRFCMWMQEAANHLLSNMPPPEREREVTLHMPHGDVVTMCTIVRALTSEGEDQRIDPHDLSRLELAFSNIRHRRRGVPHRVVRQFRQPPQAPASMSL